jgi:hypothetical protein
MTGADILRAVEATTPLINPRLADIDWDDVAAALADDLAATPAPLDVERLARAIDAIEARHVREGRGDRLTTRDNDELAVAIAAAYAEETP